MRKPILLAVVAALVLVVLPIGSVSADSPYEAVTELVVKTKFDPLAEPLELPNGMFKVEGDVGLICDQGWSFDEDFGKFSPRLDNQKPAARNVQADKVFVCDADSYGDAEEAWKAEEGDGFVMRLQIHFGKDESPISWVIVDGWGAYAGIAGNGKGTSVGQLVPGVTDTLSGKVRLKG